MPLQQVPGLSLNKTLHVRLHTPTQYFIAMAHDSKLHNTILWRVISVKMRIGKKITGFEIMTLNHIKI